MVVLLTQLPPSVWRQIATSNVMACLLLLLPPAVLSGASFLLAVRMAVSDPALTARGLGNMAAVNTLGGIVGSILAGFVLLPLLGMQRSILVLSGTSIAIGTLAWLWCDGQQRLIKVPYTLVFVCLVWLAIPLLLGTTLPDDYVNWGEKIVSIREGKNATMAVVLDRGVKQLKIDGWWQGEDRKNHQIVAAHLPMLLRSHTDKVPVVGVGAGQTPSRFLMYDPQTVECVDIEPVVFAVIGDHFPNDWMTNPRVRLIHEDGRSYLARRRTRYDVISLELGQVFLPGVASFYTSDFYQFALDKLNPGGYLCQFVPAPFFEPHEFRRVLATFLATFPQSTLWYNKSEFLLIGVKDQPFQTQIATIENHLAEESIFADLDYQHWGGEPHRLNQLDNLLALYLAGPRELATVAADVRIYTDDLPELEYSTSRREMSETHETATVEILEGSLGDVAAILGVAPDSDHLARIAAMRVKNLADVSIEAVLRKVDAMPKTQRAYAQIVRSLESGLKANPEHVKALRTTADAQMLAGQLDKAEVTYRRALAIRPDDVMASRGLALTMHRTGRLDEAVPLYEFVLENIEDDVEIHNYPRCDFRSAR